jgi:hypothetical protein
MTNTVKPRTLADNALSHQIALLAVSMFLAARFQLPRGAFVSVHPRDLPCFHVHLRGFWAPGWCRCENGPGGHVSWFWICEDCLAE